MKLAIVCARFNPEITDKLLESCLKTLSDGGVLSTDIDVVRVPGSFEIPWAAQELARGRKYNAVICLGAIMKGETPQNNHIAAATVRHIQAISIQTRVPCILGVITPDTDAQAKARTKGNLDRGHEAALAALEMAGLAANLVK